MRFLNSATEEIMSTLLSNATSPLPNKPYVRNDTYLPYTAAKLALTATATETSACPASCSQCRPPLAQDAARSPPGGREAPLCVD